MATAWQLSHRNLPLSTVGLVILPNLLASSGKGRKIFVPRARLSNWGRSPQTFPDPIDGLPCQIWWLYVKQYESVQESWVEGVVDPMKTLFPIWLLLVILLLTLQPSK